MRLMRMEEILEEMQRDAPMTRSQIIKELADRYNLPHAHAVEITQMILDSIVETVSSNDRVELRGFGTFGLRTRSPRRGHNPKTGITVMVPTKYVPFFRAGKSLRELVNHGPLQQHDDPEN
jgi:integration host factor subunit beta